MADQEIFLKTIGDNYRQIKKELQNFSKGQWDEDIFQDSIVKCYNAITKKGYLKDTSLQGCKNYLFRSFKTNLVRETQYCRNKLRANWSEVVDMPDTKSDHTDLFNDYASIYICHKIEQAIRDNIITDDEYYCFRQKTFNKITYKKLNIPDARKKVKRVRDWCRKNIDYNEIVNQFNEYYD